MSYLTKRTWLIWTILFCTLSAFCLPTTHSQDTTPKKEEAPAAKKKAEPKGRLPAYYGDVVSGEQKEKIYSIQAKYINEIKNLQEQLTALVEKRDDEVAGVLTAEQKAKVAKLQEAAKVKRSESLKKKTDATPAPPTVDTTKATSAPAATATK